MSRPIPPEMRIEPYVERLPWSGCWIWMKSVNNTGYGTVAVKGKPIFAHRFSWEFYRGQIPEGQFVLHRCDTRCCVNPDHLFLGDQSANQWDAQAKGRRYKQPADACIHGHPAISENIYFNRGQRYCRICHRVVRERAKAKRIGL